MSLETRSALRAVPPLQCTGRRKTCQCADCVRRRKQYRYEHHHGHRRMIDTAECREHMRQLAALKIGKRTIAGATGVSDQTLRRIWNGEQAQVRIETARRILAFTPAKAAGIANNGLTDFTATRKRLQALIALGYRQEDIAERLGRAHGGLFIHSGHMIQRWRALAILELCKQIRNTPGPSKKAATQARNKGWRVPDEYDEDLFYAADWDGTEADFSFECEAFSHVAEYDFLSATMDIQDIAPRLGISPSYLRTLLSKRQRGIAPFGRLSETTESLAG